MAKPLVSVFTPAYNRARFLPAAYASLCASTVRDIEWVVADDGSTDGTRSLMEGWQKQAPFPIRYLPLPHRGKMRTMNAGVQACAGTYFFELDSDDELTPDALERLLAVWRTLPDAERYCGVVGRCLRQDGTQMGRPFPADFNAWPEKRQRAWRHADACMALLRTEVMQAYPFPLPDGLDFVPEAVVWRRMLLRYRQWYTDIPCYIYHRGEDAGSFTARKPDPRPAYFYYCYFFNEIYPQEKGVSLREYGTAAVSLDYAALRCGRGLARVRQDVRARGAKALCALGWPAAALLFRLRKEEKQPDV